MGKSILWQTIILSERPICFFERPLTEASGFSTTFVNVGEVENQGVEVYLEGTPINRVLVWTTGFSFAKNKNEVLSLINESDRVPVGNQAFRALTIFFGWR